MSYAVNNTLGLLDMPVEVMTSILKHVIQGRTIEVDEPYQLQWMGRFACKQPDLQVLAVGEILNVAGMDSITTMLTIETSWLPKLLLREPCNTPFFPTIRNLSVNLIQFQNAGGHAGLRELVKLKSLILTSSHYEIVNVTGFNHNLRQRIPQVLTDARLRFVESDQLLRPAKDLPTQKERWAALIHAQQEYRVVLQIKLFYRVALTPPMKNSVCTIRISNGKLIALEARHAPCRVFWTKEIMQAFDVEDGLQEVAAKCCLLGEV